MKSEVREYLPDNAAENIQIDDVVVVKMNDQKLHGITFKMPGVDAAPTLYVDEMYEAYKDGADMEFLAGLVAKLPTPLKLFAGFSRCGDARFEGLTVTLLGFTRDKDNNLVIKIDSPSRVGKR
jgi:hypothetical protein